MPANPGRRTLPLDPPGRGGGQGKQKKQPQIQQGYVRSTTLPREMPELSPDTTKLSANAL